MTVWQTIGIFVLIPLGLYAVLAGLTLRPTAARGPRYRPGAGWPHDPVWWTAYPEGTSSAASVDLDAAGSTARGGARGTW